MSEQMSQAVEPVAATQPTATDILNTHQEVVQETPEQANPEPKEDKFASKFAALSRKEKAILEMKQAVKREQEAWKSSHELKEYEEFKALKSSKSDPLKMLEKLGISYDDLTRSILGATKEPTIEELATKKAQEEISKLREEMTQREKQQAEKHYESVINNFKTEISQFLDANAEAYELTKTAADEPIDLIYEVIEQHYAQNKKVMSVKEAADLVELHFEEKALGLTKLKKLQSKLGVTPTQSEAQAVTKGPSKTLTNSVDTTTATASKPRQMTREESLEAAARLIKFV